jgi:hypothetical protein
MQLVSAVNRVGKGRFRAKQWPSKRDGGYTVLNQFKQDAPWRCHPATDKQKEKLKQLGVSDAASDQ